MFFYFVTCPCSFRTKRHDNLFVCDDDDDDDDNSAADCSIAFKFGTESHHIIGDTPQMYEVKGAGHMVKGKVTAKSNVSAAKML